MRFRRARAAAVAAAVSVTALSGPPAVAKARPNACAVKVVSQTRRHIEDAIQSRVSGLQKLAGTLDAWTHVSADHRSVLNQVVSADQTALAQLDGTLGRVSDCKQVGVYGRQVVSGYQVYALVLPQTYLTLAADVGAYGASQLVAAEPELRTVVEQAPAASRAQAQALWVDLVKQAASAQATLTPVGDAVLRLSPSSFPGASAILTKQAKAVSTGRKSLAVAVGDTERLELLAP